MPNRFQALCDYIQEHSTSGEPLTLEQLSKQSGLSRFHLQRSFKAALGVSPKQYVEGCRLAALRGTLRAAKNVTDAIYEAGFASSSRVYERVDTRLGMIPSEYRAGGKGTRVSYVSVDSPLGRMMMGATDRGLCFIQFAESDEELLALLQKEYPAADLQPMPEPYSDQFQLWMASLAKHLRGEQPDLDLPMDVRATAFQLNVWKFLQTIPYGKVYSYSEVAAGIGKPSAVRAVARACASNTVAIIIPCHRVIRGDGGLGGYRWGLSRKRTLIDRERSTAV